MLFSAAVVAALAALTEAAPKSDSPSWLNKALSKRQGSTTMLRFGCPQVVIDRLDPLVNPGAIPSPHVWQYFWFNSEDMD
jgi:hypothetical protein